MRKIPGKSKIKIFQIYFKKSQHDGLSKRFTPYFKQENEEIEWREYWTFRKNYRTAIASKGLTGYVSWKFEDKSRVPAEKFLKFIENNPGFDVYYINPFPLDGLLFDSVWDHGDFYHSDLTKFTSLLLKKAGYELDIMHQKNTPAQTAYSNYWVGNSKFWKMYMDFTYPMERYIRTRLTDEENKFMSTIADNGSNCSYIPFILERMFTTFLVTHPDIKALSYSYDKADIENRYSGSGRRVYSLLVNPHFRESPIGKLMRLFLIRARMFRNGLKQPHSILAHALSSNQWAYCRHILASQYLLPFKKILSSLKHRLYG